MKQSSCLPLKMVGTRAWYGGEKPAEPEVLRVAEADEAEATVLFMLEEGQQNGEYAALMRGICDKLCDPDMGRMWTAPAALQVLLGVLSDFTSSLLERVQVLERIGHFTFAAEMSSADKKIQVETVLGSSPSGHSRDSLRQLVDQFAAIWTPQSGRLLDHIINRPATAGRVLAGRLNAPDAQPLKIVGHTFSGVHSTIVQYLAQTHTAAYEREREIHLLTAAREALDEWEKEPLMATDTSHFSLFETLLLHELAEVVLDEIQPLEPLPAHMVASTFERCLKGPALALALEAFFLEWTLLVGPNSDDEFKTSLDQILNKKSRWSYEGEADEEEETDEEAEETTEPSRQYRKYKLEVKDPGSKCVLAIDDSSMVRFAISEAAKKLGCQTLEAEDGVMGVAMAKLNKPDVIVLDIIMAEKGGLETLEELRADPDLRETPIIMLTVESNQKIVRRAIEGQANDYLVKPISAKELRARIGKYLD